MATAQKNPDLASEKGPSQTLQVWNSWAMGKEFYFEYRIQVVAKFGRPCVALNRYFMNGEAGYQPSTHNVFLPIAAWERLKQLMPAIDASLKGIG